MRDVQPQRRTPQPLPDGNASLIALGTHKQFIGFLIEHYDDSFPLRLPKEKMFKTSGHLPYDAESMFPKMEMDEDFEQREKITAASLNWKSNWPTM